MRHPIQYALTFPNRLNADIQRVDFSKFSSLTFEKPDFETFKNLSLAYFAMEKGGNMPCVLNAANEVVVSSFMQNKIGFLQMSDIIEKMLHTIPFIKNPDYEDFVKCDNETRIKVEEMI